MFKMYKYIIFYLDLIYNILKYIECKEKILEILIGKFKWN